jgi:hypothetical protein
MKLFRGLVFVGLSAETNTAVAIFEPQLNKLRVRIQISSFTFPNHLMQEHLMAQVTPKDPLTLATFKSTRLIDLPTTEVVGVKDLSFILQHHLGPISAGPGQAFGLDMAKIRLAFEFGLTDRLQLGMGRTNGGGKPVDGSLKFRLLRQQADGGMPLSVTVQTAGYYQTAPEGSQPYAMTADFALPIPPGYNGKFYAPVLGAGVDLDTGGHIFQLFVTNSPWLNDDRLLTETAGTLGDAGTVLRLGFQVNRTFGFGG